MRAPSFLAAVVTLAREDLRLTLRDRSSIWWIFMAPVLWVWFFGFLAQPPEPARTRVSLGVSLEDDSKLAQSFVETLRQTPNVDLKVRRPGDPEPAENDRPSRTLTVPQDFGEAIAARKKVTLTLAPNSKANAEATLAAKIAIHKAIVRLLVNEIVPGFDPAEDRVVLQIGTAVVRPMPAGYYQTIPGNLIMFVLISTLTYGAALLGEERNRGILRRLAASPLDRLRILSGKLAGRMAVASVQVLVFLTIGLTIFRIDWGDSPAGLLLLLGMLVFCSASLGLLSGALFRSPDAASGIGIVFSLALAALAGCWWPFEIMPGWLQSAAYALPTTWAMNGMHELISWGGTLRDVLPHAGVLFGYGAVATAVAVRKLRVLA